MLTRGRSVFPPVFLSRLKRILSRYIDLKRALGRRFDTPAARGLDIGVEPLGHRYEADSVVLQRLDVVQAVRQGAPEAVEPPNHQAGESPCLGMPPSGR